MYGTENEYESSRETTVCLTGSHIVTPPFYEKIIRGSLRTYEFQNQNQLFVGADGF